jgi:hypothetical protein
MGSVGWASHVVVQLGSDAMLELDNSPAQKPLGRVLESDDGADYYPVANPFLYFLLAQRALLERLEGRIGWQKEGKPPAEDGWSVMNLIEVGENMKNVILTQGDERRETQA